MKDWTEGAEIVGSISLDNEPWQFYDLMVLRNDQGYYLATDSGCSCPIPFENYSSLADATGPLTAEQAREEATSLWEGNKVFPEDYQELMERIK